MAAAEIQFPIEGMHCAACAARIERVLAGIEGVREASVSLAGEKAHVRFDPERTRPADLTGAVEHAGYRVPLETARLAIQGMTCAACAHRVEGALEGVEGVASAYVNPSSEVATVAFVPGLAGLSDLFRAVERAGYAAAPAPSDRAGLLAAEQAGGRALGRERLLLGAAAILTLPLVVPMVLHPLGIPWMPAGWVQWLLATPVQFVAGWRFYRGAATALRSGAANMDVLVALGTTVAYALSVWLLVRGESRLYFESGAAVITLVLVGKGLEARARRGTTRAIRALMDLRPRTACVLRDGREATLPVERVRPGDTVVVRPGERVPVDGLVVEGASQVDEAMITGESVPVSRSPGDPVTGGSINGEGLLRIEAIRVGEDSTLAHIIRLVEGAQASKPRIQRLVDRVAAVFVPCVMALAAVTFAGWLVAGAGPSDALLHAAAVLVIACPCALGLATPAALMVGTGVAARAGILIRDADALERAHAVSVVVFDKTGTLTQGRPEVLDVFALSSGADELLARVGAVQEGSEHPLGRAVIRETEVRGLDRPVADGFVTLPGRGIEARVGGHTLSVGSRRLMVERGVALDGLETRREAQEALGRTVVFVARDGKADGILAFGDPPRAGAAGAVRRLEAAGVEVAMVTGDRLAAARRVGEAIGIRRILAEVLPAEKAAEVRALGDGRVVAMVGDGINDAPALAAADVGFAMGTGTDVAMASAGVTLMRSEPALVADAIDVSRATVRKIRQNLFWAFIYNVVGIPLAAFGFLSPMIAGGAMALSSVSVVSNALLLGRWRPGR